MKVGILGGSFDPVHNEHLAIAKAAASQLGLDKLIVVPAFTPPHKRGKKLTSPEDRTAMLSLAFEDFPSAEISDYEISSGGTSYSYLTCRHYQELYPEAEIFFIIGMDMLVNFFHWKNPEDILSNVTLAVCGRDEGKGTPEEYEESFFSRFGKRFVRVHYDGQNVSSTQVRVLARIGEDISSLVPCKVASYIEERKLYLIPCADRALSLEKRSRAEHSKRVAFLAGMTAGKYHIDEYSAVLAGVMHDVAKNLPDDSPYLKGFAFPKGIPSPVMHQYTGAYVAENAFGIHDEDVLNAIRYHTTGRRNMSPLEKLIYLADMLESGRNFPDVERLRGYLNQDLDECMYECLKHQVDYLKTTGAAIDPITLSVYEEYKEKRSII